MSDSLKESKHQWTNNPILNFFSLCFIFLGTFRFVGGELNTCYNAVDRHVEAGNGEQVAIIYDSPITKQVQHITYKELLDEVWVCYLNGFNIIFYEAWYTHIVETMDSVYQISLNITMVL